LRRSVPTVERDCNLVHSSSVQFDRPARRVGDLFADLLKGTLKDALGSNMRACRFTPVGRFFAWLCRERAHSIRRLQDRSNREPLAPGSSSPDQLILPCHLPERPHSLFVQRLKGRRRNRQALHRHSWIVCEYLLSHLDYIFIGAPKCEVDYAKPMGEWRISGEQMIQWEWLRQDVARSCRLVPFGTSRGALRVNQHLHENLIALASSGSHRHISTLVNCCAFETQPERVKLPAKAGIIRPEDHLKGEHRYQFTHQELWTMDPEPPGRPRPCHLISHSNEAILRRRLLDAGAATLVPLCDVPRDPHTGDIITAGVFSVSHSEAYDRMICDRRPFNHGEHRAKWLRLPLGGMLVRVVLHRPESVRGSGYDLSAYFTQLKEHISGLLRNLIGRPFSGRDHVQDGADASATYMLALTTISMGDRNAVDVAEVTHVEMLSDGDALCREGLLQWGDVFPHQSNVLQGIYIDDGAVIGVVPTKSVSEPGDDSRLAQKALDVLERNQVDIAWHKNFGACKRDEKGEFGVGDENFVVWGTEVRSKPGLVGAEVSKRLDIAMLLLRATALPYTERKIVEHLLSLTTHPFCHRRVCLSFIHRSHKWCRQQLHGKRVRWPPDIRAEITMCALSLLICESHIRWPVSTRIAAVDATPSRGGACFTTVSRPLAEALYAASEQKGAATSLRPELLPVPELEENPEVAQFFRCAPWRESRNHNFPETQHVNLQELSEIVNECEESIALSCAPCRTVTGSDSAVSICAGAKGRSPSLLLNGVLQRLSALSIFGRRESVCVKVGTRDNPGDDPSRDVPLRSPQTAPDWLLPLLREERIDLAFAEQVPAHMRLFREGFAGCAALTKSMRNHGIPTGRPLEPKPAYDNRHSTRYIRINDIMQPDVIAGIIQDIMFGLYTYWHFGLCCGGWGKANDLNGGTRTIECPMGGGKGAEPLERELLSNEQARVVCLLCTILHKNGCFWSIENPKGSHVWRSDHILHLLKVCGGDACFVHFDQCCYGLQLPGSDSDMFCLKSTIVLTNICELQGLSKFCPGVGIGHRHDCAWGSAKVDGKRYSKAAAAGRYPAALVGRWSDLAAGAVRTRFWNGVARWSGH